MTLTRFAAILKSLMCSWKFPGTAPCDFLPPRDETVWNAWEDNLLKDGEPLLSEREQPKEEQKREGLDELFV